MSRTHWNRTRASLPPDLARPRGAPRPHRPPPVDDRNACALGELTQHEALNLHRWAHMLGFRGHFLTKSQRYSVTFRAIRHERRAWRLREDLAALDRDHDDPNTIPVALETVVVINDWVPVRFGYSDDAERELAAAIAERNRQHRRRPQPSGGHHEQQTALPRHGGHGPPVPRRPSWRTTRRSPSATSSRRSEHASSGTCRPTTSTAGYSPKRGRSAPAPCA
ncbi:MAG: replication initiator [Pseudonocardia sp.]